MNKDSPFDERKEGGDKTEDLFVEFCKDNKILCYRYENESCYDRKNRVVRNAPDFIVINKKLSFVEVKGGWYAINLKIKDFESYEEWNNTLKVFYYFYFYNVKKFISVSHDTLIKYIHLCKIGQYKKDVKKYDDKKYYIIPYKWWEKGLI